MTDKETLTKDIYRCHSSIECNQRGFSVKAYNVSAWGKGHISEGQRCEDYSFISQGNGYAIVAVADGHSSCNQSYYGAKFAVDAIVETVKEYDEFGIQTQVLIRDIHNRIFFEALLKRWKEHVLQHRKYIGLPECEKEYEIYYPYGTTLLACIVVREVLISIVIGDGGFYLLKSDGIGMTNLLEDDDSIGDAVHTSMCDLNAGEFSFSIHSTKEYNGAMIMSDGFSKPWDNGSVFPWVNNISNTMVQHNGKTWSDVTRAMNKFIEEYAHPQEFDDVSIAIVRFEIGDKNEC